MITTPAQQTTQQTRTQTMLPLLALCLGYFMTILDVTIVNVALAAAWVFVRTREVPPHM